MGLMPLEERPWKTPFTHLPCEDTLKRPASVNQEIVLH